jgi:hypothetical protein
MLEGGFWDLLGKNRVFDREYCGAWDAEEDFVFVDGLYGN